MAEVRSARVGRRGGRAAMAVLLLATAVGANVALATPAGAATAVVFVAAGGADTNDCLSTAAPCATITHALGLVDPGGTVHVAGTISDNVTVTKSVTITGALAPAGSPAIVDGGAAGRVFAVTAGSVTLDHLIIRNGKAIGEQGGGIFQAEGTTLAVTDSTVTQNVAVRGGGIATYGTLDVTRSAITDNDVAEPLSGPGGGGIYGGPDALPTIVRSTISGNDGFVEGGGVWAFRATIILSTIAENQAGVGAAVSLDESAKIIGSTIAGNGNGLNHQAIKLNDYAHVTIAASITAANQGSVADCTYALEARLVSLGYNVTDDPTCYTDNDLVAVPTDQVVADVGLGALQDNGGPTETMALAALSPAIGIVPNPISVASTLPNASHLLCPMTDQRGVASASGVSCDAGAFHVSNRDPQVITWDPIPDVTYPETVDLAAYAHVTSLLPLTFSSKTFGVCAPSGDGHTVIAIKAGTCRVSAWHDGNSTFLPATPVDATYEILRAPQGQVNLTSTIGQAGTPLLLKTSGGNAGLSTFAVDTTAENTSGCVVSAAPPYTLSGAAGTCFVRATRDGGLTHVPQTSESTQVYLFASAFAGPTLAPLTGPLGTPLPLNATGGPGTGVYQYATVDGTATGCSLLVTDAGLVLDAVTGGTCIVQVGKSATGGLPYTTSGLVTFTFVTDTPPTLTGPSGHTQPIGSGFAVYLDVTGSPTPTVSLTDGTLPAWLSFTQDSNGRVELAGQPPAGAVGIYELDLTASNGNLPDATHVFTLTVQKGSQPLLTVSPVVGVYGEALPVVIGGGAGSGAVTVAVADVTTEGCAINAAREVTVTRVGLCQLTVTRAGDDSWIEATRVVTLDFAKADQDPVVLHTTDGVYGTPTRLDFTGGSGGGTPLFDLHNGTASQCSLDADDDGTWFLDVTGAGTCLVKVGQHGDDNHNDYLPAAATTVTIAKAPQPALTVTPTSGLAGFGLPLTIPLGLGTGVRTFSVLDGVPGTGCFLSGQTLHSDLPGTCVVTVTKLGDGNHLDGSTDTTVTMSPPDPQAPLYVTTSSGTFRHPLTLEAEGGSTNGAVTFEVSDGTATGCAADGSTLTSSSAGTCVVTATMAGGTTHAPVSSEPTDVTLGPDDQDPLSVDAASGTFGGPAVTLSSTGGSSSALPDFAVIPGGTAPGCALAGPSLTAAGAGTCRVNVTKAADANFKVATSPSRDITFARAGQTPLTASSAVASGPFGAPIAVSATGGSTGGTVSYQVIGGTATGCAVVAGQLRVTGIGTCTITATMAGNDDYDPVVSAPITVTFVKGPQPLLGVSSTQGVFGAPLTLATSGGGGGGAVTYTVVDGTATGCVASASAPYTLLSSSPGTCTVTAAKAGDADYEGATSTPTPVNLTSGTRSQRSLRLTSTSGKYAAPVTLTTSGGSGNGAVVFVVVPGGTAAGCAISSSTPYRLTTSSPGTCKVMATKYGDATYKTTSTTGTVSIAKGTQPALTVGPTAGVSPLALTVDGGAGTGAVTFSVSNGTAKGCAVTGSGPYHLTSSKPGTCKVTVKKAGDVNYAAAASKATTITITLPPVAQAPLVVSSTSGASPLRLATSGGSGAGAVTYTVVDGTATGCTVSPSAPVRLSSTTVGTCTVTATKAGDINHLPASSAPTPVSITAISPPFTGRTITGTVIGTIFVLDGESVLLDGARVVGHVIVQPGGTLYTEDAVIAGRVIADRPAAVRLCGSDVAGSRYNPAVVINGSSGSVILGDPASGCAGNRFRSDVILTANQSVVFGGNTATYVTVSNNGPGGTVLKGNTVTRLSCSGNTPAPTNAGQPNRGSRRSQCASL